MFNKKMLSFIVPVLNEEPGLNVFYEELLKVIPTLSRSYEIIFIDDGSTDNSLHLLQAFEKENKNVRVFSFRRNLGKSEALTLGFMKARGEYVITLDADLQDKPTEIHKLLDKTKEGVEVVCGWRKNRLDKSKMVIVSKLFNYSLQLIFNLGIHDYNCGLKVYSKEAAKSLRLYGGLHRFIPLLAFEQGFIVDEVEIQHSKRVYGKSKYGISKIWKDLPDMFTMIFLTKFSKRPLHFFGFMGGLSLVIGLIIMSYLTGLHYLFHQSIGTRPAFFGSILLILGGFQILFTGFLADLVINISQTPDRLDEEHVHFPLRYSSDKKNSTK